MLSLPPPSRRRLRFFDTIGGTEWLPVYPINSTPDEQSVCRMTEAFQWLAFIPPNRQALTRILVARCLVSPITGRHLVSWRMLAHQTNADRTSVRAWHDRGCRVIAAALARPEVHHAC